MAWAFLIMEPGLQSVMALYGVSKCPASKGTSIVGSQMRYLQAYYGTRWIPMLQPVIIYFLFGIVFTD